jgi:hypothetical protein
VTTEYQRLAAELDRLKRRVDAAQRSRLGNSSLENASVPSYDETGQLQSIWGRQFDGAHGIATVAGPTPPTPGGIEVEVGPGHLLVDWAGEWDPEQVYNADTGVWTPVVAPSDFSRVEIHVSTDANMTGLLRETLKTTIPTPRGQTVRIELDYDAVVYVRAVTRSTSGKPSVASPLMGPFTVPRLTAEDIAIDLNEIGGNKIHRGLAAPGGPHKTGDLWLQTPSNVAHRWEGDPGAWVVSRDQGIVQALQDAFDANAKAVQAGTDALAARDIAVIKTTTFAQDNAPPTTGRTAGDVWIDTNDGNRRYIWNGSWTASNLGATGISATARQLGAITTFRQPAAPTTGMIVGDFWVDSDDGNKVYIRTASAWELSRDPDINAAITNAATAQATADGKMRIFPQADEPTGLVATDVGDLWIETDNANRTYTWTGTVWEPRLIGNNAIQPQSLVASDVVATGTITAALLESYLVIATVIIAGDQAGEHTRIDSSGVTNYAIDADGLPVELGKQGRGWSVRNPLTGDIVASCTEDGILSVKGFTVEEADPVIGGSPLSEQLPWHVAWGNQCYGKFTGGTAPTATNTEAPFLELAFTAKRGRQYVIFMEGIQPTNAATDPGGWQLRLRATTATAPAEPATPTTASTQIRQWTWNDSVDNAWNVEVPQYALYNGPSLSATDDSNVRLLFTYGVGTGTAPSTGASFDSAGGAIYCWVMDVGPSMPETGDEFRTAGTSGGTTTRKSYTYEATATYVRTWNQSGSIIYDDELHQGYGDSFNGIRRSMAMWVGQPDLTKAGTTIEEIAVYMESYHWYAMAGGTLYMGRFAGGTSEPAAWPAASDIFTTGFTARAQGKWIVCPSAWRTAALAGSLRGISLTAPSTSSTYYGKFRGPANARPRLRIKYTQ